MIKHFFNFTQSNDKLKVKLRPISNLELRLTNLSSSSYSF